MAGRGEGPGHEPGRRCPLVTSRPLAVLAVDATGAAASAGAPALEAYPVDTAVPGHIRNLFLRVASVLPSTDSRWWPGRTPLAR